MKQYKFINSDILKLSGIGQSQFSVLGEQLAKNADFGFNSQIARFATQWAKQQSTWFDSISRLMDKLKTSFYPSTLHDIEDLELSDVEQVVMLDGIALYEVPRAEIAEKFIRASSSAERREILGRRWKAIAADCRASLEVCESKETAHLVTTTLDGIDALEKGNVFAAQALAGSVTDTLLRKYMPKTKSLIVPGRKPRRPTTTWSSRCGCTSRSLPFGMPSSSITRRTATLSRGPSTVTRRLTL